MKTKLLFSVAASIVLAMGCGPEERSVMPTPPAGFDEGALAGSTGKADALTRWFTVEQGPIAFGASQKGETNSKAWFHGYTIELAAGDHISVRASGESWGYLALYGPKTGKDWGPAQVGTWIRYQSATGGFAATIEASVKRAGTYYIVLGSPWNSTYRYKLGVSCSGGSCRGVCLEYETVADDGTPYNNAYALNLGSAEEAKAYLAQMQNYRFETITEGHCSELPAICPRLYLPVCGSTPEGSEQTFGNTCEFKSLIRQTAGLAGQSKGHWEMGRCSGYCLSYETIDADGTPLNNYYAINVADAAAAQAHLANVGSYTNDLLERGACDAQGALCPRIYQPVCSDMPEAKTEYDNVCLFKAAVRQQAGATGEYKGHWDEGVCTRYCLTYETLDADGTPYRNFYVINVVSPEAAKAHLANVGNYANDTLDAGACNERGALCQRIYQPVCTDVLSPSTEYENICLFKADVRQRAGDSGQYKGHWDEGTCQP